MMSTLTPPISAQTRMALAVAFMYPPLQPFHGSPAYDSHRPALLRAVLETTGQILELGMGYGSTIPLHVVSDLLDRPVRSVEENRDWYAPFAVLRTSRHRVDRVPSYEACDLSGPWGLVFVDHQRDYRAREIVRLRPACEVMVVHDTESVTVYKFEVLEQFKYRLDFKPANGQPWTSIVSDTVDLSQWPAIEDPTLR